MTKGKFNAYYLLSYTRHFEKSLERKFFTHQTSVYLQTKADNTIWIATKSEVKYYYITWFILLWNEEQTMIYFNFKPKYTWKSLIYFLCSSVLEKFDNSGLNQTIFTVSKWRVITRWLNSMTVSEFTDI